MKSKIKRNVKGLPTSKLWLSLQSGPFLRREAYSRRQKLFPPREKLQQKHRLSSSAARYKPTSLTAEGFQQRNRDLALYGKNQFCIRYQKTGMAHTLNVNHAMIRGEPIISISALKVPLCRQRFLRNCPLYLSHSDRMEKKIPVPDKVQQEAQMISAHGSKSILLLCLMGLMTITFVICGMTAEKRAKIKFYEKKYSKTLSYIQEKNQKELSIISGY